MRSRVLAFSTTLLVGLWLALPAAAQDTAAGQSAGSHLVLGDILATVVYGVIGILLAIGGFLVFELITPFSVNKELSEDHNVAVGIVVAAMFLGIAFIVGMALSS